MAALCALQQKGTEFINALNLNDQLNNRPAQSLVVLGRCEMALSLAAPQHGSDDPIRMATGPERTSDIRRFCKRTKYFLVVLPACSTLKHVGLICL